MGVQNSINSMLGSAALVAGSKALKSGGEKVMNNQAALQKSTQALQNDVESIRRLQSKIQSEFGMNPAFAKGLAEQGFTVGKMKDLGMDKETTLSFKEETIIGGKE